MPCTKIKKKGLFKKHKGILLPLAEKEGEIFDKKMRSRKRMFRI